MQRIPSGELMEEILWICDITVRKCYRWSYFGILDDDHLSRCYIYLGYLMFMFLSTIIKLSLQYDVGCFGTKYE